MSESNGQQRDWVAAVKARRAAVSSGQWTAVQTVDGWLVISSEPTHWHIEGVWVEDENAPGGQRAISRDDALAFVFGDEDSAFITHAPEAIDRLVAEVESYRSDLHWLLGIAQNEDLPALERQIRDLLAAHGRTPGAGGP
jgi:hypothetical protein